MDELPLLTRFLVDPSASLSLDQADRAELLVRQARAANLLSRVAWECGHNEAVWNRLPEAAARHLESAQKVCEANHRSVRWEVRQIKDALAEAKVPFCLLKGAAYVLGNERAARGRVFGDVDILVPATRLQEVERLLIHNAWLPTKLDAYDQRYYRQWMHELPPMRHIRRGTTLDVHHTIVPPTMGLGLSVERIWESAREIEGMPGVLLPAPEDMILHNAAHLFFDGEFENGLRDLSDFQLLIRSHADAPSFWERLVDRADLQHLGRPLFYALRYARRLLGLEVPQAASRRVSAWGPKGGALELMDALFLRGLAPNHATSGDRSTPLAHWTLYVRSHWLRMPPLLLAQHLSRKIWRRFAMGERL